MAGNPSVGYGHRIGPRGDTYPPGGFLPCSPPFCRNHPKVFPTPPGASIAMSTASAESQLQKLKIELPPAPAGVGAYVGVVRTGNLIVTSGQLPWQGDKFLYTGKVGGELTLEEGFAAARQCALNAIAQLKSVVGDLEKIRQIVRVEGYVHCAPGFRKHPLVLNGASELLNAVFGERGRHTRVALGIADMPLDAPVQIVVWAEVL
jgi:enamine deaminase RidA (YjgF/YER057c/UK114 family)